MRINSQKLQKILSVSMILISIFCIISLIISFIYIKNHKIILTIIAILTICLWNYRELKNKHITK